MAEVMLDRSDDELTMLRDAVIRAHGMATGQYAQTDQEMRRRIGKLLDAAIDASPAMAGFLGRGGPEAHRDVIGGSGHVGGAATAARAEIVAWLEWRFNRMQAMARDLCAEEITGDAGTYRDIADAIESGAPQRWAAGREGHSSPPKGEV